MCASLQASVTACRTVCTFLKAVGWGRENRSMKYSFFDMWPDSVLVHTSMNQEPYKSQWIETNVKPSGKAEPFTQPLCHAGLIFSHIASALCHTFMLWSQWKCPRVSHSGAWEILLLWTAYTRNFVAFTSWANLGSPQFSQLKYKDSMTHGASAGSRPHSWVKPTTY